MRLFSSRSRTTVDRHAWMIVVSCGVVAGMHIWKLPAALDMVRSDTGMSLVEAGILVAMIQVASLLGGLAIAWFGDALGLRRLVITGLCLLSVGSLLGGLAGDATGLLASRALEGVGFLLCTVLSPSLIRRSCSPEQLDMGMAGWGAFQGLAAFVSFAATAVALQSMDWRSWWIVMAFVALAPLAPTLRHIPADPPRTRIGSPSAGSRTLATLRVPGPYVAGLVFACYTAQWTSVMGFLPTIYAQAEISGALPGLLSAAIGGVNAVGALIAGPLMRRGLSPTSLIVPAFAVMAVSAGMAFAIPWETDTASTALRFATIALFSLAGGAMPAVLSRVGMRLAPPNGSSTAVIGIMQQLFNVGNVVGPPLMAWLATAAGGWHATWWMTTAFSGLGIILTVWLHRVSRPKEREARARARMQLGPSFPER